LRKRDVSLKDSSSATLSNRRSFELQKLHYDKKLQNLQRQNMELKSTLEEVSIFFLSLMTWYWDIAFERHVTFSRQNLLIE